MLYVIHSKFLRIWTTSLLSIKFPLSRHEQKKSAVDNSSPMHMWQCQPFSANSVQISEVKGWFLKTPYSTRFTTRSLSETHGGRWPWEFVESSAYSPNIGDISGIAKEKTRAYPLGIYILVSFDVNRQHLDKFRISDVTFTLKFWHKWYLFALL